MKQLALLVSSATLALAAALPSYADVSTNITAASDYVWRGISQTANGSAIQGGIDYDNNGFFVGSWLSNTSFGTSEVDLYLGYGGEVGDFGYSATFNYYWYASTNVDSDFGEVMLDFSYSFVSIGAAFTAVSDIEDAAFTEGDAFYYIGIGGNVGEGWNLGATYGFYDFDADGEDGIGDLSYGYAEISATKNVGEFGEIGIAISIADEEANNIISNRFSGSDVTNADEPIARVSWSKSF